MSVGTEQLPQRHPYRARLIIGVVRCFERRPHFGVLDSASERDGESMGIGDSRRSLPALVREIAGLEAIKTSGTLGLIALGGVFQVGDAALVHLLGDPAFVADVAVAASLVEGGEDALDLWWATAGGGQPGAFGLVSLDVGRCVAGADLREPGAGRFEAPNGFTADRSAV
jgi:hypothetical protein